MLFLYRKKGSRCDNVCPSPFYSNIETQKSYLPLGSTNQPPPPRKNLQPKYSVSKASVKSVRCCKGSVSSLSGFFS